MRENPPNNNPEGKVTKNYMSNQVYLFDLLEPKFTSLTNLSRGFLSLYPPFYDGMTHSLLLINEESVDDEPDCISYSLHDCGIDESMTKFRE